MGVPEWGNHRGTWRAWAGLASPEGGRGRGEELGGLGLAVIQSHVIVTLPYNWAEVVVRSYTPDSGEVAGLRDSRAEGLLCMDNRGSRIKIRIWILSIANTFFFWSK